MSSSSVKVEEVLKVEKRLKKEDKPLVCYNCGDTGILQGSVPVSFVGRGG